MDVNEICDDPDPYSENHSPCFRAQDEARGMSQASRPTSNRNEEGLNTDLFDSIPIHQRRISKRLLNDIIKEARRLGKQRRLAQDGVQQTSLPESDEILSEELSASFDIAETDSLVPVTTNGKRRQTIRIPGLLEAQISKQPENTVTSGLRDIIKTISADEERDRSLIDNLKNKNISLSNRALVLERNLESIRNSIAQNEEEIRQAETRDSNRTTKLMPPLDSFREFTNLDTRNCPGSSAAPLAPVSQVPN